MRTKHFSDAGHRNKYARVHFTLYKNKCFSLLMMPNRNITGLLNFEAVYTIGNVAKFQTHKLSPLSEQTGTNIFPATREHSFKDPLHHTPKTVKVKVKQFHYRPGLSKGLPGI